MMRRERLRPRPQPRFLVVKPGLKISRCWARGMPLPVSSTSISTWVPRRRARRKMAPVRSIRASSAFLSKFSITHSKRMGFRGSCMPGGSSFDRRTVVRPERAMRERTYSVARSSKGPMGVGVSSGSEPILEKRSAMFCRWRTSSCMAAITCWSSGWGWRSRSSSIQAMRPEIGVPS